jgi:hypothetical protein
MEKLKRCSNDLYFKVQKNRQRNIRLTTCLSITFIYDKKESFIRAFRLESAKVVPLTVQKLPRREFHQIHRRTSVVVIDISCVLKNCNDNALASEVHFVRGC